MMTPKLQPFAATTDARCLPNYLQVISDWIKFCEKDVTVVLRRPPETQGTLSPFHYSETFFGIQCATE